MLVGMPDEKLLTESAAVLEAAECQIAFMILHDSSPSRQEAFKGCPLVSRANSSAAAPMV